MQIAEYDNFRFYTDDPVFFYSINHGQTEPYPLHLDIVKRYLSNYPHKNRTYIDIGAHIGTTIMPYSRLFHNVIGYEANPSTYELLCKNIEINGVKNTNVYNFGLFSEECRGDIIQHNGGNSGCYFFMKNENGNIFCKTLDGECKNKNIINIDFIKLDTEGCEMLILQGGIETILVNKPFIQFETNASAKDLFHLENKDTIQYLLDLGYSIYDQSDPCNIFMYYPDSMTL
jgi:FkbM family methyltransferase